MPIGLRRLDAVPPGEPRQPGKTIQHRVHGEGGIHGSRRGSYTTLEGRGQGNTLQPLVMFPSPWGQHSPLTPCGVSFIQMPHPTPKGLPTLSLKIFAEQKPNKQIQCIELAT